MVGPGARGSPRVKLIRAVAEVNRAANIGLEVNTGWLSEVRRQNQRGQEKGCGHDRTRSEC